MDGLGEQVVFSSVPSVVGSDIEWTWKAQLINTWLRGWCHLRNLGFFDHGEAYSAPGLMAADGSHLSQRGKQILAQELAGLIERALN